MSYRIKVNDFEIFADTPEELVRLVGAIKVIDKKEEKKREEVKTPSVKKQKKKKGNAWTAENIQFLVDNMDNRPALKALPYNRTSIKWYIWVVNKNRIDIMPEAGKPILAAYNMKMGRNTPREYLPKI